MRRPLIIILMILLCVPPAITFAEELEPYPENAAPEDAYWTYYYFETYEGALAAFNSSPLAGTGGGYTSWGGWWSSVGRKTNGIDMNYNWMYCVSPSVCAGVIADVLGGDDTDGDGIPNDIDPYPDDDTAFEWKIIEYQKDASGNYTFLKIQTDSGDVFDYGTLDDELISYLTIGASYSDGDDLLTHLTAYGMVDSSNLDGGFTGSEYISNTTEDGVTGGGTDSELLGNIEGNTAAIADNQQALSDSMTGMNNELLGIGTELETVNQNLLDGNEIATNIHDALEAIETAQESMLQDELDAESEYNSYSESDMTGVYEGQDYTQLEADAVTGETDGTGLTAVFDFLVSNNPAQAFIDEMDITFNGVCSITVPCSYGNYELSICQFADELALWGNLILGLSTLTAFMIVFKRS